MILSLESFRTTVYLPVQFQRVVFLLPLVQCRATLQLAPQMTPKPHHFQLPHRIRQPAFSVVTMTPLLNRPFRPAPHHIVLRLPKATHSFPLHLLHYALVAVSKYFNTIRVNCRVGNGTSYGLYVFLMVD